MLDANLNSAVNTMPRKVSCKLDFGNGNVITDVKRLTYDTDFAGTISVGQCISAYIDVTIPTPVFPIAGVNVTLSMGITVNNAVTWTQIGVFRVDEESVRSKQGQTSFGAYDKLNNCNYYVSNLSFPNYLQNVLNEVCGTLGITSLSLAASENKYIEENIFEGYTLRDVLGFIAGYCGRNAYLSPTEGVQFRWFDAVGYEADGTRANIPYIGENDCTIRRWICSTQSGTLTAGSGQGIYFTCPFMEQGRLNDIASYQQLPAYRKAEVDIPFGTYLLQAGDIITVSTTGSNLSVPIMSNSWTYDGGLSSTVASYGASDYTGNANNVEQSLSAARVQSVIEQKVTANRVTDEINHATDVITGATGGVMRLNMGGNGKPAELLILDTGNINTAQNVCRLNEGGFGFSSNGYNGSYATAITADGHIVADRITGNRISGVELESVSEAGNSQVIVSNGAYEINHISGNTSTGVGKIGFQPAAGQTSVNTLALEVFSGGAITIGELSTAANPVAPDFVYYNSPPNGSVPFHVYETMRFYDDVEVTAFTDEDGGHSLIKIINDLAQRVHDLETQIGE